MKLKTFNVKATKVVKSNKKRKSGVNHQKKVNSRCNIPLDFFKGDNKLSIENTLNTLPSPIQQLLSNGNNPVSIKYSSSIIEIKTDSNLIITIKTHTIDDDIPQCKIFDKNEKVELLNTYKR